MAFDITQRVNVGNPSPHVDLQYGPYDSIAAAKTALTGLLTSEAVGKTIGIKDTTGRVAEYTWAIVGNGYDFVHKVGACYIVHEGDATIQPNTLNVWKTQMSTLTITKGNEIDGIVNNFVIRFTAGEDCGITFNGWTLQWYGGEAPTWTTGCTYEISIVDNIALWAEFEPKQA